MNIFVLDNNIEKCAMYHNDKHVNKMILESAQMLSMVHWLTETDRNKLCLNYMFYDIYLLVKRHINHPCSKWVRKSLTNYRWLCSLAKALCKEYTYRRGRRHKTETVIDWCIRNHPNIPDIGLTPFAKAIGEYKTDRSVVDDYRNYYRKAKAHLAVWIKREKPYWY